MNRNTIGKGWRTLDYDQLNRLLRVEQGGSTLGSYKYNGLNQRVSKSVDGVTTLFVHDFDNNIVAEAAASGSLSREYLYWGTNRLALVDMAGGGEELYYFQNDHLGTPTSLTNTENESVWEAVYAPFGEAKVNMYSTVVNNFRFPGQYYDAETGLHYNWNRYYDPSTGRYLTPDPIGLAGGLNLYAYVQNNPVNFVDPMGLETTIVVSRLVSTSTYISGQISAVSSTTGESVSGYTLEHGTGSSFPHINEGTYDATVQTHSYETGVKYSVPRIRIIGSNVNGGQIHNGNNVGHSTGCTLAANDEGNTLNTISDSINFMRDLNRLISNDGGGVTVTVQDFSGYDY
jgi:RHS repeat-associated protein